MLKLLNELPFSANPVVEIPMSPPLSRSANPEFIENVTFTSDPLWTQVTVPTLPGIPRLLLVNGTLLADAAGAKTRLTAAAKRRTAKRQVALLKTNTSPFGTEYSGTVVSTIVAIYLKGVEKCKLLDLRCIRESPVRRAFQRASLRLQFAALEEQPWLSDLPSDRFWSLQDDRSLEASAIPSSDHLAGAKERCFTKRQDRRGLSHGNQVIVTNVQLRLLSFRSNLSGSGSENSNATSEETPNIHGHHPSDHTRTDCQTQE